MFRRVAFFVVIPLLAAATLLIHQLVTTSHSAPSTVDETELMSAADLFAAPSQSLAAETNEDESTDLYGNQVTAAVATYEFDDTGTPYERHSPQTLLPRLGSPKS
jgi:hypothetical protein